MLPFYSTSKKATVKTTAVCLFLLPTLSISSIALAQRLMRYPSAQTPGDMQKIVNFLMNNDAYKIAKDANNTFDFMGGYGLIGSNNPYHIDSTDAFYPLSYVSSENYWDKMVCAGHASTCAVTDVEYYNSATQDYHLWPSDAQPDAAKLQFERINASAGTNIYDAATYQIALALAASQGVGTSAQLFDRANNVTARLVYLNTPNNGQNTDRAFTPSFSYGDAHDITFASATFPKGANPIREPALALSYRMLAPSFFTLDPLADQQPDWITMQLLPGSQAKKGDISWADWKPIMGENAWANLIGPIQTAYLQAKANGQAYVDVNDPGIQNAMYVLYAFQRMQSPIGAFYYAPQGTYGNDGQTKVPEGEISTENNLSALAGLRMLREVLSNTLEKQSGLSDAQQLKMKRSINLINIMLYGGQLPYGGQTAGLLSFFKNDAFNHAPGQPEFFQGGIYANGQFTPNVTPRAVDVNTWGVAVLGPQLIDQWFGAGTAADMLTYTFQWGGYRGKDGTLWGVGYSDNDEAVMSGEWTEGAINALRIVLDYYQSSAQHGVLTKTQDQTLQAAEKSMTEHVVLLRSDHYPAAGFPGTAKGYDDNPNQLGFVYASKRYDIPFGWFANPVLSTASTAWALMQYYNFNPFALGGAYDDYKQYSDQPPAYNPNDISGAWTPDTKTFGMTITNTFAKPVAVTYEASPNSGWKPVTLPNGATSIKPNETVEVSGLPNHLYAVGAAYTDNGNWYGLCNLTQGQIDMAKQRGQTIRIVQNIDSTTGYLKSCAIASGTGQ